MALRILISCHLVEGQYPGTSAYFDLKYVSCYLPSLSQLLIHESYVQVAPPSLNPMLWVAKTKKHKIFAKIIIRNQAAQSSRQNNVPALQLRQHSPHGLRIDLRGYRSKDHPQWFAHKHLQEQH